MKAQYVTFCILFFSVCIQGQTVAITEYGDTVYLHDDGYWFYNLFDYRALDVKEEEYTFVKSDSSDVVLVGVFEDVKKVKIPNSEIILHYDSATWKRVPPAQINEEAIFTMSSFDETMYSMLITEEARLDLEFLVTAAMENIVGYAGVEPNLISSKYVDVNGQDAILAEYSVDFPGMEMRFLSLYHSSENGSSQYTFWTFDNVFEKRRDLIMKALSSIVFS